jgi:hypothetical protein
VSRLRRGEKCNAQTAVLIFDATDGAVDPYELTHDREGVDRLLASRKRRVGISRKRRTARAA